MPCFHPLKGYLKAGGGWTSSIVKSNTKTPLVVPCGQCIGCRLERSRQWAVRCMHEASLYDDNCFITLTYDDAHLPVDRSLDHSVFQKFLKRLRFKFGSSIRFYMCGEYGDRFCRPHYHALLFNFDFPDKVVLRERHGEQVFTSEILSQLWPFGFHEIGSVTFASAAYCARYVCKKVTGSLADDYYEYIDPNTGEIFNRVPDYNQMSRMPGIGKGWFDKFHASDVAPHDHLVVNGHLCRPPRYYDSHFELLSPLEASRTKLRRKLKSKIFVDNTTPERLSVREKCAEARLARFTRDLD